MLTMSCGDSAIEQRPTPEAFARVEGKITSHTVWSKQVGTFLVSDDVVVERGITLSLEPGTVVNVAQGRSIVVHGRLIADGSVGSGACDGESSIIFTSNSLIPAEGDWQGILFDNTNEQESILRGVTIEYADIGIDAKSSSVYLAGCVVSHNNTGIRSRGMHGVIEHNLVQNNINGIFVGTLFTPSIVSNSITGNEIGLWVHRPFDLRYNNILANFSFNISIVRSDNDRWRYTMVAADNWWGTTETEMIDEKIWDIHDDGNLLGEVRYHPYATESFPGSRDLGAP